MPAEESAIQLVPVPELWSPPGQALTARAGPGYVQPVPVDEGPPFPRQFPVLLAEVLAGARPVRQVAPWLSKRGSLHLHRLMPLLKSEQQPRVLRVLTTRPAPNVVEMTVIAVIGPRPRALAIRLEHHDARPRSWLCTDIESA